MKVLLLSDTHSCYDGFIKRHAAQADEIWHAGDWGGIEVADQLNEHAPFFLRSIPLFSALHLERL